MMKADQRQRFEHAVREAVAAKWANEGTAQLEQDVARIVHALFESTTATERDLAEPQLTPALFDIDGMELAQRVTSQLTDESYPAFVDACLGRCRRDLLVAMAAERGHTQALQELRQVYLAPALAAARSYERSGVASNEIESNVLSRLLLPNTKGDKPLASYRGDGGLAGFLRVIVNRAAQDALRAKSGAEISVEANELESICNALPLPDVELEWIRQNHLAAFKQCFHEAASELPPDLSDALRLHLTRDMSIDDLAVLFQVHRATAARMLKRAHLTLLEETRIKLTRMLGLPEADCMSLIRAMLSQAELSIARALDRDDLASE